MARNHILARLVPAALLMLVSLLACSQNAGNPTPPPATDPADRLDALVLGPVQSAHLDALGPNLNLVQHDGSQKVADYDLLVFDGDAHAPQALQDNALIDEALRSDKWVLGLDVSEDHKRTGFADRLGAVDRGASPGWMVRMGSDENSRTDVWIVDAPKVQAPLPAIPGGVLGDSAAQLSASANAYASTVMFHLRAPLRGMQQTPVPPNLSMATYHFSSSTTTPVNATYKTTGNQTAYAQYNYTFKIFLDNSNNPQGDFQWVSVEADGTGNPTSGTRRFANYNDIEKAWFQDKQTVSITPSAADNSLFTSFGSSPATANGVTSVTTGTSFTVGLSKDGPTGSFTYTNEKTQSLQDWKLDNNSSGNTFSWNYRSNNPIDADQSYSFSGQAFGRGLRPKDPNAISMSQIQLSTQGVWKTNSIQDQKVDFEVEGSSGLVDLYCPGNLNAFGWCVDPDSSAGFIRYDPPRTNTLTIDMGSVAPISIASVTFSPGASVQGGTTVIGTVTLAEPAKINTVIGVTSNSQNATLLPTVTVLAGRTSATFEVETNTNGLTPGASTVATIQTLYAQGFQAQLTVKN